MKTASWAAALVVAAWWPARLAGPLDGAPLDGAAEAVALGLVLPALVWLHPSFLRTRLTQRMLITLLAWKAFTAIATVQDGWCVRFTSPVPIYLGDVRVPRSWDIRTDWRDAVPSCSAVMTRGYSTIARFPVWFYNLPPAKDGEPAALTDRPPHVTAQLDVSGYLHVDRPGVFAVAIDDGVHLAATINGTLVTDVVRGVQIEPGTHQVALTGQLTGSRWRLMPEWNGRPLWSAATATLDPPRSIDLALRPWGPWLTAVLLAAIIGSAFISLTRFAGGLLFAPLGVAVLTIATVMIGNATAMRLTPLLLVYAAWMSLPSRLQDLKGALISVGIPFLALFAALGSSQAGVITWYTSGDDWWEFQRFAYRIYVQGFWLEAGETTFWFQPFYRYVAGALHLVFGDASVGELFWDAAAALVGAAFAFQITRLNAGYRWGIAAAVTTLALMLLGPAWYLFGRGLSEITSAGFLYAAALLTMRASHGHVPSIVAAGVLAVLAFYTRLNNLPMAIALTAFAWRPRVPVAIVFTPARLIATCRRAVFAGLIAMIALGITLFTARTYYYTGVLSFTEGTQAGHLSVWQPPDGGGTIAGNVVGSVLTVLTMTDPPRPDPRALPIVVGVIAAIGGLAGIGRLRYLPLGAVALCLAGFSATLVARGSAYPGRFSVNLIPVTVALTVIALALFVKNASRSRSEPYDLAGDVNRQTHATSERFGFGWAVGGRPPPITAPVPYHLHAMRVALGAPPFHGRVLDAGCGEGIDLASVVLSDPCRAVGVEISDGGVAASAARIAGSAGARVIQGDVLALPFAAASFDGAYSYGVVHHTIDPDAAVREIARTVKSGGTMLFYVYEDFSTRGVAWRATLGAINVVRQFISGMSPVNIRRLCSLMAPAVYLTCTLPSRVFPSVRFPYPASQNPTIRSLVPDLYDRFAAPIERRYSEIAARRLAEQAGCAVRASAYVRGWAVWAEKL